ncbi:MAG: hydroxymyristoyl-ACP dehydratase [Candidatus Competibacteraceae bacterium]|nr:hydroxymyristoyl-ACP dehydratase [Candidatus Competibacteraceae bacterium]
MLIDKAEILGLIPHQGTMCLLDGVIAWDDQSIVCTSSTHRDPDNPLRCQNSLAALHAVEYGAQATAIHGGLRARQAGQQAPSAFLAALKEIRLFTDALDTIEAPLTIEATRLAGDIAHFIYRFRVSAAGQLLAEGRVTVITRPESLE